VEEVMSVSQFGTADDAKAMLERAVAALKENKTKALDMFNKGGGGFKDRDLYVWAANISDGILTAHPQYKGKHLQDFEGKHGAPFGQTIIHEATHGVIKNDLLVAETWIGQAAGKDYFLY
jgi:hypothetical protein